MNRKNLRVLVLSLGVLALFSTSVASVRKTRFADETSSWGLFRFMGTLERFWYDFKFRTRAPEQSHGVMVAKIDDAALERFGRWPWNRSVYKEVLDYLFDLGAEVVGFDAVFSEPEFQERYLKEALVSQVHGRDKSIEAELALSSPQVEGLTRSLPDVGDRIFASAVLNHPKTVLGYFWQDAPNSCPLYDPENPEHKKEYDKVLNRDEAAAHGRLHVESLVDSLGALQSQSIKGEGLEAFKVDDPGTFAHTMRCPVVNRSAISANAKRMGYFNAIPDNDGLFRRSPLVLGFASEFVPKTARDFLPGEWFKQAAFFPSLALQTVVTFWNSPGAQVESEKLPDGRSLLRAIVIPRGDNQPPVRIETLADGTVPLNFYGSQNVRPQPIPEFSLAGIQSELFNPEFQTTYGLDKIHPLKNQIVLIGPTALGVYDLRPSPVQGDSPGVYIHAAMVSRILEKGQNPAAHVAVRFAPAALSQALLWGIGLVMALLLLNASALQQSLVTTCSLFLFLGVDFYLFSRHAYALDSMTVALGMLSVSLSIFAYKYFTEEKERAFVKGAFEKYVSPDVVSDILKDPKKLNLGGQKRELTVLFSDIRGFTTISERMGAAELAKFMNDYLSPMTDIVLENRGTIDKYMGDAIMAIFGAPVEYSEHPAKACDAALSMMRRLQELKKEWAKQGLPPIDIGVGINTGEMSVGNMGSSRIFSYTVMGDSVNLGSRLEGINKEYGTHVIVSEFTRKHLGPEYLCRELDRVKVKGKHLPVTIFEVMGKEADAEKKRVAEAFESGLKLYYAQKFSEAKMLFQDWAAVDPTAAIYTKRCESWMESPPGDDWDGSWTMKSK